MWTIKDIEERTRRLAKLMSSPEAFITAIQQGIGVRDSEGNGLPMAVSKEERKARYYSCKLYPLYHAMIEWLEATFDEGGWFYDAKLVWEQEHNS